MSTTPPVPNPQHLELLAGILKELLAQVQTRGYFGQAVVEICVQDGRIQYIQQRLERRFQ